MASSLRNRKYRKAQGLIAANKIKPEIWRMHPFDIIRAINAAGCNAKKLKKVKYLRHQISISYWNDQGGVCSGFFSYRIFHRWQCAVQKLVHDCRTLYEVHNLSQLIEYEFAHYRYASEIQAAINQTIEGCTAQIIHFASYKRTGDLVAS
jgi:hypothetical protein